ncbi:hypothetical protein FNF29_06093 [Cafeteria roenbergensis]|uniref:Uncharacterized protein n=1 Tax=Cafeteria roenbergensis TaxID=33653 RepID=A0A5A8C7X5_CAFRO|nr:hypothetical protein FNF29_06093 [Cafeteria roenbergensis]|eukprot:KAA0149206.1 hypothetical protein FNF29_06093 [Cafeteria roenbergensis]
MSWVRRLKAKCRDLQAAQHKEDAEVEHEIDSHPLEPQLSAQVVEMMRMEESASRAGSVARRRQLTSRIDSQIASECRAALNYIVDLHTKQRKDVWARHAAERSKLRRSVARHAAKHGAADAVAGAEALRAVPSKGSSARFSDAEAQALREASANWLKSERYSLLTAFRQQVRRVQTEWSDHVQQLRDEYSREYRIVTGSDPPASDFEGIAGSEVASGERNWLSKAKQETLIHTAPVLAPDARSSRIAGTGSSAAGVRDRFFEAVAGVVRQQEDAVRWILRQCRRMLAQAAAQERERLAVAMHRDSVDREWAAITLAVEAAQQFENAQAEAALAGASSPGGARSPASSRGDASPTVAIFSSAPPGGRGRYAADRPRPSGTVASSAPAFLSQSSASSTCSGTHGGASELSASGAGADASSPVPGAGPPHDPSGSRQPSAGGPSPPRHPRLGDTHRGFSRSAGRIGDGLGSIPEAGRTAAPARAPSNGSAASTSSQPDAAASMGSSATPVSSQVQQGHAFHRGSSRAATRARAETVSDLRSSTSTPGSRTRGSSVSSLSPSRRSTPGSGMRSAAFTTLTGNPPRRGTPSRSEAAAIAAAAAATTALGGGSPSAGRFNSDKPASGSRALYRVGSSGSGASLRRSGKLGLSASSPSSGRHATASQLMSRS